MGRASPERISIGRNVSSGSRCHLRAGPSTGRSRQLVNESDVATGRDVWLGGRVVALPGVTIGDGALVGAAAVVTKSVSLLRRRRWPTGAHHRSAGAGASRRRCFRLNRNRSRS
jgi:tetrahydrodipicolinate N-succinyltransferase